MSELATISSLGFSIFSTYNGRGVNAARRDINQLTNDTDRNSQASRKSAGGFGMLTTAAAALGPGLLPVGVGLLGIGAAAGSMGVAAAIGFGAFGKLIKEQISNIQNMDAANMKMTKTEKEYLAVQDKLSISLGNFSSATRSATVAPLIPIYHGLAVAVKELVPTFKAAAAGLQDFGNSLGKYLGGNVFGNFIKTLTVDIKPIMHNLSMAALDFIQVLVQGVKVFLPEGVKMSAIIKQGADNLKKWSDEGGFARFLDLVHRNAPQVKEFFSALGAALKNVSIAMAGLGPVSLSLSMLLLKIVAALPPSWIQAIVVGFLAWRAATLGMMVISALTTVVGALSVAMGILDIVAFGLGITMAALLGWIALAIIAVAALVVGIIFLVQNWTTVWNAIKMVAVTVWGFLTHGLGQLALLLLGPIGILILLGTHWRQVWTAMLVVGRAVWAAMGVAWRAFLSGMTTAWNATSSALKSAWNACWAALRATAHAAFDFMRAGLNTFVNGFKAGWNGLVSALKSAWNACWAALRATAHAAFDFIRAGLATFASGFKTTWNALVSALKSAWNACWAALRATAHAAFDFIRAGLATFASGFKTTWNALLSALKNAWNAGWDAIRKVVHTAFTAMRDGLNTFASGFLGATKKLMGALADAWEAGAKAIGKAWASIKKLVRDPIQAVVSVVYNNGIVKLWNVVAGVFGAPKLSSFTLPGFATGGAVRGPGTGTSDSITARLSAGEHVITAKEVQGAGGHDAIAAQRQAWANNVGTGRVRRMGKAGSPYYALGGGVLPSIHIPNPIDVIGDAFDAVKGFGGDILKKLGGLALGAVAGVVNPLIQKAADVGKKSVKDLIPGAPWLEGLIVGGPGGVASTGGPNPQDVPQNAQGGLKTGNGIIQKMADYIKNWITAHDVAVGGGNTAEAQKWADAQVGKPYSLGGNFGTTFDCSQFMSGITQIILGKKPSPLFTTFAFTGAKQGPATFEKDLKSPFQVGVTNKGVGHMAGTLNGKNYEATPPAVRSGPSARGATNSMFDMVYGMKAAIGGGTIPTAQHKSIIDAALKAAGVPPPGTLAQWENGLNTLITRESNWNSGAVNNTDSNAKAGHPSKGLAQVIQPTFDAFHVPGTSSNILDPVANIAAAINYIVHTYGNITNVQQANASLPPKGYRKGTDRARKGWHKVGEDGEEWVNFGGGEKVLPHGKHPRIAGGEPVTVHVENHWHGNPTREAVQYAEGGMCDSVRQAVHAGVGRRAH